MLTTIAELEALYGEPHQRAVRKEIDYVNEDYRRFIELSPFVVLATGGPDGLDCSPRGDAPGFVRILDERTLALPDRVGNNRVDSLRNVVVAADVALLFMVPGVGETLRVNGRGRLSDDPALLADFAVDGKLPRSVLLIDVEAVYFHCSKAIAREMHRRIGRDHYGEPFDAQAYDVDLAVRIKTSLY